jgi:hypothetical protein
MTETMPCIHVTPADLLAILENHSNKGAKIVHLVIETHPKLTKKSRTTGEPCPHVKGVTRVAGRRIVLGANYGNAVNRELRTEGESPDFQPESLWKGAGQHHGPYTVQHRGTGRLYFVGLPQQLAIESNAGRMCIVDADLWYDTATMEPVDPATLADYLPPLRKAVNQGVRHDIQWRTFPLDEIKELTYAGICYAVHQPMTLTADDDDSKAAA